MNTQTLILTVMIFWLIMGLAFLSAYSEVKRTGGTLIDVVVGLVVLAFRIV